MILLQTKLDLLLQETHNSSMKFVKCCTLQWLSKNIHNHVISWKVPYQDQALDYLISNIEVPNVDMP